MVNGWRTCCSQCHYVECSSAFRAYSAHQSQITCISCLSRIVYLPISEQALNQKKKKNLSHPKFKASKIFWLNCKTASHYWEITGITINLLKDKGLTHDFSWMVALISEQNKAWLYNSDSAISLPVFVTPAS